VGRVGWLSCLRLGGLLLCLQLVTVDEDVRVGISLLCASKNESDLLLRECCVRPHGS
jgi:hypothetical protein